VESPEETISRTRELLARSRATLDTISQRLTGMPEPIDTISQRLTGELKPIDTLTDPRSPATP
jgi:hypothetical protein